MRRRLLFIAYIICFGGVNASASEQGRPMTVCEVLQGLETLAGKEVAIRGQIVITREWSALVADCDKNIDKMFGQMPRAIYLSNMDRDSKIYINNDDRRSLETMKILFRFLETHLPYELSVNITATYTGTLRAKRFPHRPETPIEWQQNKPWVGFGHLGAFPAELIYRRVEGIVIEQRPAK